MEPRRPRTATASAGLTSPVFIAAVTFLAGMLAFALAAIVRAL